MQKARFGGLFYYLAILSSKIQPLLRNQRLYFKLSLMPGD